MNTLRECAEAAVKTSGADGWQITGGTAHAWAVTLYFNRDGEVKRNAGNHDGADGGRSALVASEDPRLTRARGETELAPPRRSWKRLAAETPSGGVWRVSEIDDEDKFPVTVIEGHIDLAEIEREAYRRGEKFGYDNGYAAAMINDRPTCRPATPSEIQLAYDDGYNNAMESEFNMPQPIAGVEPVVVEGFTTTAEDLVMDPWCIAVEEHGGPYFLAVRPQVGTVLKVPCTVAIWPGVRGGKRAGGRE